MSTSSARRVEHILAQAADQHVVAAAARQRVPAVAAAADRAAHRAVKPAAACNAIESSPPRPLTTTRPVTWLLGNSGCRRLEGHREIAGRLGHGDRVVAGGAVDHQPAGAVDKDGPTVTVKLRLTVLLAPGRR